MNPPITPGEILLEEYLKPMGISPEALGLATGVSEREVEEVLLGQSSITPSLSKRIGVIFGQSENFWHGIQIECGYRQKQDFKNQKRKII